MISSEDHDRIVAIARKYHARRILLFGSSLESREDARDIDLGVEGVAPADFFSFYGELLMNLSKPVDVIDLDEPSGFSRMVRSEGMVVYG